MSDQKTVLYVKGMNCQSCVRRIDVALRTVEGVSEVEVRLPEGKVAVLHAPSASVGGMIEALANAGYRGVASAA